MAFLKPFLICILLTATVAADAAGPLRRHFRLALDLGALRLGSDVTFHPDRWLSRLRGRTFLTAGTSARLGDGPRLKLKNYGLVGDIYTFGQGWRISAGVHEDGNHMLLQSSPQPGMPIGEVTTRQYAPVVAIGYGGTIAPGLSLGGDIGMVFEGRGTNAMRASASMLVTPADVAIEQSQPQRDTRRSRHAPVFQMSAAYRF